MGWWEAHFGRDKMNDAAGRLARLRDGTKEWLARAKGAAPHALSWVGALVAIALVLTIGWAVVLILGRAGEEISTALIGGAPIVGRVLGYLFMAALLAGGAALFFVAVTAILRLSAWALSAIATLTANKTSAQAERYVVAGLLALLPAAGIYFIATQTSFQLVPVELKQHLIPVLLPFAIGAVVAPAWGRGQALTLTVFSLAAVAGIVAATGYLWPSADAAPNTLTAVWHWADLMRQSTPMQRLWWMLLVLLAIVFWAIAVFAGSREGELAVEPPRVRFNPLNPAGSTA
jgi:hypothetical protein